MNELNDPYNVLTISIQNDINRLSLHDGAVVKSLFAPETNCVTEYYLYEKPCESVDGKYMIDKSADILVGVDITCNNPNLGVDRIDRYSGIRPKEISFNWNDTKLQKTNIFDIVQGGIINSYIPELSINSPDKWRTNFPLYRLLSEDRVFFELIWDTIPENVVVTAHYIRLSSREKMQYLSKPQTNLLVFDTDSYQKLVQENESTVTISNITQPGDCYMQKWFLSSEENWIRNDEILSTTLFTGDCFLFKDRSIIRTLIHGRVMNDRWEEDRIINTHGLIPSDYTIKPGFRFNEGYFTATMIPMTFKRTLQLNLYTLKQYRLTHEGNKTKLELL